MDTLQSMLNVVTRGCYRATVDLKDAYYSVPVTQEHRKYFRFIWRSKLFLNIYVFLMGFHLPHAYSPS